jgi:colicin import membrane protein
LKNADYINKEAAILIREDKRFIAENKIFRKEVENLREIIFEKKRKRKRRKVLNFHKKNEMED